MKNDSRSQRRGRGNPVINAVHAYATALIRGDEKILSAMTVYTSEGSVGKKSAAKTDKLRSLDVTGVGSISSARARNQAVVQFNSGDQTPCIGLFQALQGDGMVHIQDNWQLYELVK